jgi:hypothetical protein
MATDEEIRKLAYSIWEQEGCPEGKDVEHYLRAKKIIETKEAGPAIELAPPARVSELPPPKSVYSLPPVSKKKMTQPKRK